MDSQLRKYCQDILDSIHSVNKYIGTPKKFEDYEANPMLQDAVERNLEIIGEAMNRILKHWPEVPVSNSRRIVDARNIIIHSYDALDNAQVWAIVINHLPQLESEVQKLL